MDGLNDESRQRRVLAYNDALVVLRAQPLAHGSDPAEVFLRLYRVLLAAHEHVHSGEWPADAPAGELVGR